MRCLGLADDDPDMDGYDDGDDGLEDEIRRLPVEEDDDGN